ncbi:MAG: PKD domain-containing protein [Solirubrobacterales bacterium]
MDLGASPDCRGFAAAAAALLAGIVPVASASGQGSAGLDAPLGASPFPGAKVERVVPAKPKHTELEPGDSRRTIQVKFDEGTFVRERGGEFTTLEADRLGPLRAVMDRYPGARIARIFNAASEATLDRQSDRIERTSGRELADPNLWYQLTLPAGTDLEALIDGLNALAIVEIAEPEPNDIEPNHAGPTPSFVAQQDYREMAPTGIDADYAGTVLGGRGSQVEIIDIERAWQFTHEDLSKADGALIANGTPQLPADNDHGTAVIGEMVGDANTFGVTGAADQADLGLVNRLNDENTSLATAIDVARMNLVAGDVMIIEVQIDGPNGNCAAGDQSGCVPVEWSAANYDAITTATAAGIIVMEPAGNGNEDLGDTAIYGGPPFPSGKADSGAIMVGAANHPGCTTPVHGRSSFSNFGPRVDYHGYGECVVTTGYGDLQTDPNGADFFYTDTFGGTSSATPIVTSAAAVLSSVAQQNGDADGLDSFQARAALAPGATAQELAMGSLAGNIGPMPNLRAALGGPTADAGGPYAGSEGSSIPLDGSGSSDPLPGSITAYEWDLDNDGAYDDATGVNPSFQAGDNGVYPIGLRVTDDDGNMVTDDSTVTLSNVAPTTTVDPNQDDEIAEGDTLNAEATFTDPGYDDTYAGVIDWGDGDLDDPAAVAVNTQGPPQDEGDISGSHVYPTPGTYTITLAVQDDDSGQGDDQFTLTVVPRCQGQPSTVVGTPGDDDLHGTSGDDVVFAGGGDDEIRTGDGDDLVCAGQGEDRTAGRAGDDVIFDSAGDGVLTGSAGHDVLFGALGADVLSGGPGVDFLEGAAGPDDINGGAGRDSCDARPADRVRRCES